MDPVDPDVAIFLARLRGGSPTHRAGWARLGDAGKALLLLLVCGLVIAACAGACVAVDACAWSLRGAAARRGWEAGR